MWQSYAKIGKTMTTINKKKHKHKNTFVHLYSEVIRDSDQIETNLNYVVEDKDSHKYIKSQTYKHTKHTQILTSWLWSGPRQWPSWDQSAPWLGRQSRRGSLQRQAAVQEGPREGRHTWGETIIGNLKIAPAYPEAANFKICHPSELAIQIIQARPLFFSRND